MVLTTLLGRLSAGFATECSSEKAAAHAAGPLPRTAIRYLVAAVVARP